MDELEPLNWKIFDSVSRTKISSWFSEDRAKGTYNKKSGYSASRKQCFSMWVPAWSSV